MKSMHVVVPDLFLPQALAKEVCAGLNLPMLEKVLARSSRSASLTHSLESWLCKAFALPELAVAPMTMVADGLSPDEGYWLRADPVHLHLDRAQMILQTNVALKMEEAAQLCADLNGNFAGAGMTFFAPHPSRWYLRLEAPPDLQTHSIYQVEGQDARYFLPQGAARLQWHGVMNEVQMLLCEHPVNQACTARGALPVNSVWLWGGGGAVSLSKPYHQVYGDSELAALFARATTIPHACSLSEPVSVEHALYVWDGLSAAMRKGNFDLWRESVALFERDCVAPLLQLLAHRKIDQLTFEVLQETASWHFSLTRMQCWKIWQTPRPLLDFALV